MTFLITIVILVITAVVPAITIVVPAEAGIQKSVRRITAEAVVTDRVASH